MPEVVLGCTCANDVTPRPAAPTASGAAKGFDTFCPLGPWIETEVDASDLVSVRCTVNGEVPPDSTTSPTWCAASPSCRLDQHVMTLLPGDVILTGTPGGVRSSTATGLGQISPSAPSPTGGHRLAPLPARRPADRLVPVRVRFCPSPTGNPHVGMVRTGAVQLGVRPAHRRHVRLPHRGHRLRPRQRAVPRGPPRRAALARPRLGRGPEVGGPHEPYRQSRRLEIYADVARRLLESGWAYESFSTPDEVEGAPPRRGQDPKLGYDNADRHLTDEQKDALRAEGRQPVLRLRMPDRRWV